MSTSERLELRVGNLDCDHDAAAIQRGLRAVPGVLDLHVSPRSAKVRITFDPSSGSADTYRATLHSLGFPVQEGRAAPERPRVWRDPKVLASAGSGVLLLVTWLADRAGAPDAVTLGPYLASAIVGGWFFGREAIEELIFERQVGIELLMTVAAVVAMVMGELAEGAMLAFLYSISEAAEGYTEAKTRSAIRALMDLTPKRALVRRDGREMDIPVEELAVGDVFIVKPGQAMPTDGEVLAGQSSVNQAPVTGESVPAEKAPGDTVFAGTINGEGALDVRATRTVTDNTIARIIELVEDAQEKKGVSQRWIERFGTRYSPLVLLAGALIAVVPPLASGASWSEWITRATVFIVAAAPCALVISIPITLVAALGTAARKGVLIKGGLFVEELARIQVVALDKTGTLTRGEPEVTDVIPAAQAAVDVTTMVRWAAGVERRSQHPLAEAIVRYAEAQQLAPSEPSDFRSLTAAGAVARVDDRTVYVAKPDFFSGTLRVDIPLRDEIARLQAEGKTTVLVGDETAVWGLVAIRDGLRSGVPATVNALRGEGIRRIVMLTGDNPRTAHAIAQEVGITDVFAELSPEDKAVKVRELTSSTGHVAMVGDGVNDAPALAEATVGVAMGAAGTDVALETADVALMADDLSKLVEALRLARRNQRVVQQNLALSSVVIAVLVVAAIGGVLSLPAAVFAHEISEFVVIGSGLRMLRG
jgi:Cd2+/Zn2+-exporting ATPase